ncbi:MAG: hypothetical protein J7J52_00885 [Deltaproteobacteria bacterium]|nr:hypothetical protein [Deltaproteobacteria bacterium]
MIQPIEEKIAWAEKTYLRLHRTFSEDKRISELTDRLKKAISLSRERMCVSGIVDICRKCEYEEGGSCCGKGIENRYDRWLLIINLILGIKLPHVREIDNSCFFLGRTGCRLAARHVICINYVCEKIERHVPSACLNSLKEAEGEEIETLFFLHERLMQVYRSINR